MFWFGEEGLLLQWPLLVGLLVMMECACYMLPHRPLNSPPIVHLGLPLIGNYIEFARCPVAFMYQGLHKYGGAFTVPLLNKNLTFLIGPDVSGRFFDSATM